MKKSTEVPPYNNLFPQKTEAIKADGIVVVDVGMPSLSRPALGLGVRGIISMDLKVTGPKGIYISGDWWMQF